jgi:hypothetical protein
MCKGLLGINIPCILLYSRMSDGFGFALSLLVFSISRNIMGLFSLITAYLGVYENDFDELADN